ncbi:MAG: hypothetical protein COA79_04600 [Planctomycetota bacterium]|nr:MAG: hypothetical protein COA79_04600 [Planctomycetota bacterium]
MFKNIFVTGIILLLISNTYADETSDVKALKFRKTQIELKRISSGHDITTRNIKNVHRDIVNSKVMSPQMIKSAKQVQVLSVSSKDKLKKTRISLHTAKESNGEKRSEALSLTKSEIVGALKDMQKIHLLVSENKSNASIEKYLRLLIKKVEAQNNTIKNILNDDLSGKKPSKANLNSISKESDAIHADTKSLKNKISQDDKNVKENQNLPNKRPNLTKDLDGASDNASKAKKFIDEGEIGKSLAANTKLLTQLNNAFAALKSKNKNNIDQDGKNNSDLKRDLDNISKDLKGQNNLLTKLEDVDSDNELFGNKDFDDALGKQHGLKKAFNKLKNKFKGNAKAQAILKTIEKDLDGAQANLDKGNLDDAKSNNSNALISIKRAKGTLNINNKTDAKPSTAIVVSKMVDFKESNKLASEGDRKESVHLMENEVKLGHMPKSKNVWVQQSGEKKQLVLLQTLQENGPKEYSQLTRRYYEALAELSQ